MDLTHADGIVDNGMGHEDRGNSAPQAELFLDPLSNLYSV